MQNECEICGTKLVKPSGPGDCPVMVIGEYPGEEEMKARMPFVGGAGKVLYTELGRYGIDLHSLRMTNLWMHPERAECKDWHFEQCIQDAKGRKVILILGSDCAKFFLRRTVTSMSGLVTVSDWLPGAIVISTVNPAALTKEKSTVGEFRLAIYRFSKLVEALL